MNLTDQLQQALDQRATQIDEQHARSRQALEAARRDDTTAAAAEALGAALDQLDDPEPAPPTDQSQADTDLLAAIEEDTRS